jgi:hypothetical protein
MTGKIAENGAKLPVLSGSSAKDQALATNFGRRAQIPRPFARDAEVISPKSAGTRHRQ